VIINDPITPQTRRYLTLCNLASFGMSELQSNFSVHLTFTVFCHAWVVSG